MRFPTLLPRLLLLALLFLALGVGFTPAVRAQQIVVPNSLAAAEGDVNNSYPFLSNTGRRYQQVYNASEFSSLSTPGLITQIVLRQNEGLAGYPYSLTLPNVRIRLSTTSAAADSLRTTFADNLGADTATVFHGALTLSSAITGPDSGPRNFDIVIDLTTPFLYDPAQGNLLLDVSSTSVIDFVADAPFDAVAVIGDPTSRLTAGSPLADTGRTDSLGLVTRFTFVPNNTLAAPVLGTVAAWGNLYGGRTLEGTENSPFTALPVPVPGLSGAVAVAAGAGHNLALGRDGTVVAWGDNTVGEIGDGTQTRRQFPVPVRGLTDVVAIAAGTNHSLALRRDGTVAAWGFNALGQAYNGSAIPDFRIPATVPGLTGIVAIAAGAFHSLAVRSDGTVAMWGGISEGDGSSGSPTPVTVPGLTNVVAVAGGFQYSLALRRDGTVAAWGENAFGQLGDGTTLFRGSPVTVDGLTNVMAIAAGFNHSLALRSDGTLAAWGSNLHGQIGSGSSGGKRLTPFIPGSLSDVVAIGGGINYSVALRRDGTVAAWGINNWGQLGDGTQITRTRPTTVSGLSNIVAVVAGSYHSLAVTGTEWRAGDHSVGTDNKTRLLWNHRDGRISLWSVLPDGGLESSFEFGPYPGWTGRKIAVGAGDNKVRLLWTHLDGRASLWTIGANGSHESSWEFGPFDDWSGIGLSVGADNKPRLLWKHMTGLLSIWVIRPDGGLETSSFHGPYKNWNVQAISTGSDNRTRMLWNHADGRISLWTTSTTGTLDSSYEFGPYAGWSGGDVSMGTDSKARLLWNHSDGRISLWRITGSGHVENTIEAGPYPRWRGSAVSVGPVDHKPRLLWNHNDGRSSLWTLPINGGQESAFEFGPY